MSQLKEENQKDAHVLPGKVETKDGKIHQEEYGEWPECSICKKQVEPALFSQHTNKHGG